jgi:hypothetical protein
MTTLLQDMWYGLRLLLKSPGLNHRSGAFPGFGRRQLIVCEGTLSAYKNNQHNIG